MICNFAFAVGTDSLMIDFKGTGVLGAKHLPPYVFIVQVANSKHFSDFLFWLVYRTKQVVLQRQTGDLLLPLQRELTSIKP